MEIHPSTILSVNIVGINCGIIAAIVKALSYIEHACIEDVDYSYFSPYLG